MIRKTKIIVCPCVYEKLEEKERYVFRSSHFTCACNFHKLNDESTYKESVKDIFCF